MIATLILWGHALAALLFAGLAASQVRNAGSAIPRLALVVALSVTAIWALAIAGIGIGDLVVRLAESLRNLSWLGFMFALVNRNREVPARRAVTAIYGVVAIVILGGIGLAIADDVTHHLFTPLATARVALRAMVAIGALVLVHHLFAAVAPRARGGVRLVVIALAVMWSVDLLLYSMSYVVGDLPHELLAARGFIMALTAPLLMIAVQRNGDWELHLSRTVAWQTLSLGAVLLYFIVMAVATGLIAALGGDHTRLMQTAFVFGSTTASLTLLSSSWLRAWIKVKIAKHLFRHRYDYRVEWLRFTATLGHADGDTPLHERVVKAVADLTGSPAGLLLVKDGAGLVTGATWNWPGAADDRHGEALAGYLASTGRIVELDTVRHGESHRDESDAVPPWIIDGEGWALVPLIHNDRLQGAILLARPPIDRALDWEDFDLLRVAGSQAASYLAEAQAQEALSDGQRFDEFNRRFAFLLHDIKNLVSQLTLVARNAERHADNPEFRADMIATLQESAGRMNDMLARLSQRHAGRAEPPRPVALAALANAVALRWRGQRPVLVQGEASAMADRPRLEQLLIHIVQNAVDASDADAPVLIRLTEEDGCVTLDIIDRGSGMSAAFQRDQLFKPFASTKPDGFGIGAFEARQLTEAMGGSVHVTSREGDGTCFRVVLPRAAPSPALLDHAA